MNESIATTIARAERVLAALRTLAEMPEVLPFKQYSQQLNTNLLQLFPVAGERQEGNREVARPLARLLGGSWRVNSDKWESKSVTFPGLDGVEVVLHYIEPCRPDFGAEIDLNAKEVVTS